MAKRKGSRGRKSGYTKSRLSRTTPKASLFQRQGEQAAKLITEGDLTGAGLLCAKLSGQRPDDLRVLKLTGTLRYFEHRYMEAISLLEQVYAVHPYDMEVRRILIGSYQDGSQEEKAMSMAETFLDHPLSVEETMLAFNIFQLQCDWQKTASMQDDVIRNIHATGGRGITLSDSFLLGLNGLDNVDPDTLLEFHGFHAMKEPSAPLPRTFAPGQLNPQGRLKIAYLSPDFNSHPVAYFVYSIISAHNRQHVEVYCYAHLARRDAITDKVRDAADHFIDITEMTDAGAAQRIRADGIHVLIDLAGYTSYSRLHVLRWNPAPVQISWLGYPNTSGIPEVDFHITDHHAECEGGTRYTEQLLYMPESFICFGMRPTYPHIEAAPVENTGCITFGSFANTRKMNPRLIDAWSQILNRVPDSRIALKKRWNSNMVCDHVLGEFARHGVGDTRIIFLPSANSYDEHMDQYNQIDIALDTFPYTGTTTTCEALLMGVPVVTLVGKQHASRVSYSILKNIGFTETVAYSVDEYVAKAVNLAINPGGLSVLRKTIPTLFEYSIVGRPERFTPQLEALYMDACRRKNVDISRISTSVIETTIPQEMAPESLTPGTYLATFLRQQISVPRITIAEIGARIIEEDHTDGPAEPFHMLPEVRVIAFEPNRDACDKANHLTEPLPADIHVYPYAVSGICGRQTLYETNAGMCSSRYKPNEDLLRRYAGLEVSYLKDTCEIDVITLDAFMEEENIQECDFIKIDIQGAELDVFKAAKKALPQVIGVCTEVEWAQLYENQPLFGDVDAFLRQYGLQMHHFLGVGQRPIKDTAFQLQQQALWSDAIYFPSLEAVDNLTEDKLLKLAIMASMYDAHDLAQYALSRYDALIGSELLPSYVEDFSIRFLGKSHGERQHAREPANSRQQDARTKQTPPTSGPARVSGLRRLHIGGRKSRPGWEIMDILPGEYVDHIGNANDLSMFECGTFDTIYSSHVLEHFSYQEELPQVLLEWRRVMKSGGTLYASVPDVDILCELFLDKKGLSIEDRFMVMRMMFGGQIDPYDFHKVGYNQEILTSYLQQAGFENIRTVDSFGLFDDTSSMAFAGKHISLNMIAEKPLAGLSE